MKRILITGASGFVGTHLLNHLGERNDRDIWCLVHHQVPKIPISSPSRVRLVYGNLLNPHSIRHALAKAKPHQILHMAGQASVAYSWKHPQETLRTNVESEFHLLEVLRQRPERPTVLVTCSSDEYGVIKPSELPVREDNPLRPVSPYAVSKVVQDTMAYQYYYAHGLKTIRTRAFNHTGPGRPDAYALSSFAKQVALIEHRRQRPVLEVGDLSVKRDYLDVRDVVRAYVLAIDYGVPGEVYNICSGNSRSMLDNLKLLLKLTPVKIRIQKDPRRFRPSDMPVIRGDPRKFHKLTGWRPQIPLEQTLRDLLDYWRQHV